MADLGFTVRTAKVTGKDHLRAGRNCQDGFAFKSVVIGGNSYLIGVVADGCSEGNYSEIAGLMIPIFVINETIRLLRLDIPLIELPVVLYPAVIKFLDDIRKLIPINESAEIVNFVQNYLLSTVIGFVLSEEDGVVFYSGDGYLVINDEIQKIDYQNRSPYIGYHLVPSSALESKSPLQKTFETKTFKTDLLHKIAIATDGFSENLFARLWQEAKTVLLGIQLWMNFVNGPRNPDFKSGLFYDDATIVVAERIGEDENA